MIFLLTYLGGPYSGFSGRDASRGLATFNVNAINPDEYDDLSDLKPSEIEQVYIKCNFSQQWSTETGKYRNY